MTLEEMLKWEQYRCEATEMRLLIDELRNQEGNCVTIDCDNPDFNKLPNCCVECFAEFTDWTMKGYRGNTVLQCLRMALEDKRLYERAKPIQKNPAPGPKRAHRASVRKAPPAERRGDSSPRRRD